MSNEFDDFDDLALGDALRRMSGGVPDADAALGAFHRRVRVARIRRVSIAASGTAAAALVVVGAFALTGGKHTGGITPAERLGVLDTVADSLPGTDTTVGTTIGPDTGSGGSNGSGDSGARVETDDTQANDSSSPGGTPSGSSGGGQHSDGTTTTTTVDDNGNDASGDGSGSGNESTSDDHSGSGNTTTTGVRVLVTKRCTSAGGSFTATHYTTTTVSDISPAAGFFKSEQEVEADQATLVFKGGEAEYHLVARWNGSSFSCSVES